jgi:hypothetical protein
MLEEANLVKPKKDVLSIDGLFDQWKKERRVSVVQFSEEPIGEAAAT